ncbi:MAG: SIR2 family protein [bacterium]
MSIESKNHKEIDDISLSVSENVKPKLQFIKGKDNVPLNKPNEEMDWDQATGKIRDNLGDAMNARYVTFLFGSGCSSFTQKGEELGIPTMLTLAQEFANKIGKGRDLIFANATERKFLKTSLGIDVMENPYKENLESLMETLYASKLVFKNSIHERHKKPLDIVEKMIAKLQRYIFDKCTNGAFSKKDNANTMVQSFYETFYRKLIYRDRLLPRPWVFTTNYDLFNETAMDRLGLPYTNGFSGTVERRFNPSVFRYALAEQMDLLNRKWTAVDGFIYLGKLHGSVSWIEDHEGLFPIREVYKPNPNIDNLMIYPTPAKQAASFGSPYSDIFREFQSHIVREQSVLFVLGYRFADEHVNNIIFQALTIPTFRLIIFSDPETKSIAKLRALCDPRIWIIGGNGLGSEGKAHYFNTFVEKFMPDPPGNRVETAVKNVLKNLIADEVKSTGIHDDI